MSTAPDPARRARPSGRRGIARLVPPALAGARGTLAGDAMAGLTLAAIALPASMGTAQLVGAPAIAGLAAFVMGSVIFAAAGGHRILSVGADSSIAPMLAAAAGGSRSSSPTR